MGTNEKKMTTGSPGKLIITFAIPLMLGNILQQFYTMADTMIVGQVVGKPVRKWLSKKFLTKK